MENCQEVPAIYAEFDGELRKKAEQTSEDKCRGAPRFGAGAYPVELKSVVKEKGKPLPKKGNLVKQRRLGQGHQKSHKLEPRWEGS